MYVANNKYENREFQSLQECGIPNVYFLKGYKTDGSYYDMYQVTSASGGGFTSLKNVSKVFKDNHNDVTPYNFNINLLVKI